MKDRFPSLIALFLLCALVVGTWWAAEYAQRAIPIDPPARKTHEKDSWARQFVMLRTDVQGRPINRLVGDYAEHFPDDDSYHVTNPHAVGQQEQDSLPTVGTSDTAIVDQGGKRIVMNGNAHVHRPGDARNDPLDVRSEQLIILPDDDVVYTDLPALVVKGNSRMNGKGMHYNNKTRQLRVSSSTDVEISGDEQARRKRANDEASSPNTNQTQP